MTVRDTEKENYKFNEQVKFSFKRELNIVPGHFLSSIGKREFSNRLIYAIVPVGLVDSDFSGISEKELIRETLRNKKRTETEIEDMIDNPIKRLEKCIRNPLSELNQKFDGRIPLGIITASKKSFTLRETNGETPKNSIECLDKQFSILNSENIDEWRYQGGEYEGNFLKVGEMIVSGEKSPLYRELDLKEIVTLSMHFYSMFNPFFTPATIPEIKKTYSHDGKQLLKTDEKPKITHSLEANLILPELNGEENPSPLLSIQSKIEYSKRKAKTNEERMREIRANSRYF